MWDVAVSPRWEVCVLTSVAPPGPTVLEVFNTLLKHLRLSVEFEANDVQGGSMGSISLNSASKDNDEKIVQNAIIQTIGESLALPTLSREAAFC